MNDDIVNTSFSFLVQEEEACPESIQWMQADAKCEICVPMLKLLELHELVPRTLNVCSKILRIVGTAAHKGPSLCKDFPH